MPKRKRNKGQRRSNKRPQRSGHRPSRHHRSGEPRSAGPTEAIPRDAASILREAEPPLTPTEVLDAAGRHPGPGAALVAWSLATFGPTGARPEAEQRYRELRDQGVAPGWLEELGAVRPGSVVMLRDAYGDGYSVHLDVTDRAGRVESISAQIDVNLGGIVTDVMVGPPTEQLLAQVATEPHLEVGAVAPAEARARVEAALSELDGTFDPPVAEDVPLLRALLEQRFALLPSGGCAPVYRELDEAERSALIDGFAASPYAGLLGAEARDIAETVCDFANYSDGDPLRWSPTVVAIFLVDWVPRKVIADARWYRSLPDAVRAWVRFAGERRELPGELIEETVAAVDAYVDEFFEQIGNVSTWGPAKRLMTAIQEAGADPRDPDTVAAFAGMDSPLVFGDDFDEEALLEAWERLDEQAATFLRDALAEYRGQPPPLGLPRAAQRLREGLRRGSWPFDYLIGLLDLAPDEVEHLGDTDLLLAATSAFVAPDGAGAHGAEIDADALALAHLLDHAAWLHVVTTAVRLGPGSDVSPSDLAGAFAGEADGEAFADEEDLELLMAALALNAPLWQVVGVTDSDDRLTELGAWLLPRALAREWAGEFDGE